MDELRLSVMTRGPSTEALWQPLLVDFARRTGVRVRLEVLEWETARRQLIDMSLQPRGLDVSEVGSTWITDLAPIGALHQLTFGEVVRLGGQDAYLPAAWRTTTMGVTGDVWAVPWMIDPLVLHYRRDLLAQAGLNASEAFQTYERIAETLARLQACGISAPWTAPCRHGRYMGLHNAACWIWGAGGDVLDARRLRVLFDQPEARAGLRAYYDLARYLDPAALNAPRYHLAFRAGTAALTVGGSWLPGTPDEIAPEIQPHLAVVLLPGRAFLGGTNLVIWARVGGTSTAFELVQALSHSEGQARFAAGIGHLPARLSAWQAEECSDGELWQVRQRAALAASGFTNTSLFGMVEERLAEVLAEIWGDVFTYRSSDLDALIEARLEPLARKLNIALGSLRP